jgi:hypothetical protein
MALQKLAIAIFAYYGAITMQGCGGEETTTEAKATTAPETAKATPTPAPTPAPATPTPAPTVAAAEVVDGSLSFTMTPEAATSVAEAFLNDEAKVAAAFASSIADGITGVDEADVAITDISVARRLAIRILSTGSLKVDYAITVPASITVSDLGAAITSVDTATVTAAVQTGLRTVPGLDTIEVADMATPTAPEKLSKCMAGYMKVDMMMEKGEVDGLCAGLEGFVTHCKKAEWEALSDDDKKKTDGMPYDGALQKKKEMCSTCGQAYHKLMTKMDGRRLGGHEGTRALSTSNCGGCYNADGTHQVVCEKDGAVSSSNCGGTWMADAAQYCSGCVGTAQQSGPSQAKCDEMDKFIADCTDKGAFDALKIECPKKDGHHGGGHSGPNHNHRTLGGHDLTTTTANQGSGYGYGYGMAETTAEPEREMAPGCYSARGSGTFPNKNRYCFRDGPVAGCYSGPACQAGAAAGLIPNSHGCCDCTRFGPIESECTGDIGTWFDGSEGQNCAEMCYTGADVVDGKVVTAACYGGPICDEAKDKGVMDMLNTHYGGSYTGKHGCYDCGMGDSGEIECEAGAGSGWYTTSGNGMCMPDWRKEMYLSDSGPKCGDDGFEKYDFIKAAIDEMKKGCA